MKIFSEQRNFLYKDKYKSYDGFFYGIQTNVLIIARDFEIIKGF